MLWVVETQISHIIDFTPCEELTNTPLLPRLMWNLRMVYSFFFGGEGGLGGAGVKFLFKFHSV